MKVDKTHFSEAGHQLIKEMTLTQFKEAYKDIIKGEKALTRAYKMLSGGTAKKSTKKNKKAEKESGANVSADIQSGSSEE